MIKLFKNDVEVTDFDELDKLSFREDLTPVDELTYSDVLEEWFRIIDEYYNSFDTLNYSQMLQITLASVAFLGYEVRNVPEN